MRAGGSAVRPAATGPVVEENPPVSERYSADDHFEPECSRKGKTYDGYLTDLNGGTLRPRRNSADVVLTPVWSYR
jgi:hypothetical protein